MRKVSIAALVAATLIPSAALAERFVERFFDDGGSVRMTREAKNVGGSPISSADVKVGSTKRAHSNYPAAIISFADRNNDGVLTGHEYNAAKRRLITRELSD